LIYSTRTRREGNQERREPGEKGTRREGNQERREPGEKA
jgi:hypothetical protein